MEKVQLTKSQKRNIRRTNSKKIKPVAKKIYKIGDAIMAAPAEVEWLCDTSDYCRKGYIVAVEKFTLTFVISLE